MFKHISILLVASFIFVTSTSKAETFLPTKEPYRNVLISPLQTNSNEILVSSITQTLTLPLQVSTDDSECRLFKCTHSDPDNTQSQIQKLDQLKNNTFDVINKLKSSDMVAANKIWSGLVRNLNQIHYPVDINALIRFILKESVLKNHTDILVSASRVYLLNQDLKNLNTALAEAMAQCIDCESELDAYIQELESQLNSVGNDSQLAYVDLQVVLQSQPQVLQLLSNMSKMLNDTAAAIVSNLK